MVDLQAVNEKLVRRSEAILVRLTGRSSADAREALRRADGSVKLAVLLLHGCEPGAAAEILDRAGGQLRAALASIGRPAPDQIESPAIHDGFAGDEARDTGVKSDSTR
jgi:N-acetylmuramic acid 6-phosphate etherase